MFATGSDAEARHWEGRAPPAVPTGGATSPAVCGVFPGCSPRGHSACKRVPAHSWVSYRSRTVQIIAHTCLSPMAICTKM